MNRNSALPLTTFLLLVTFLFTTGVAHAAEAVKVKNRVKVRSTVQEIPFYCREIILAPAAVGDPTCFRADTREQITPVPEGFYLVLTDVVTNRNALIESGRFFLTIGRAGAGTFASEPRFNFSGDQAQSPTIHFTSPYVVLGPGESLRASNGDQASTGGATVDVFLSGYVVSTQDLGR